MAGIVYGYYQADEQIVGEYMQWVRLGILNLIQLFRVGLMYNVSYFDGLIGLLSGILYLIIIKLHYNKSIQSMANT